MMEVARGANRHYVGLEGQSDPRLAPTPVGNQFVIKTLSQSNGR
jgi:hypothetical protein